MRNRILAIAAIAGAIGTPIAAQAQSDTVGIARGGSSVIVSDDDAVAADDADGVALRLCGDRRAEGARNRCNGKYLVPHAHAPLR